MKRPTRVGWFGRASICLLAILALLPLAIARGRDPRRPPSLAQKCGDVPKTTARPLWIRTDDGVRLYAAESSKGAIGVVLAHESPADLCGWMPYLATLEHAGLRVLAFDFRGFGASEAPIGERRDYAYGEDFGAAVTALRRRGAKRIFAIGASFGGAALLTYAHRLPLAGAVSLSGETSIPGRRLNALAAVGRLRAPLLIVGSRQDRYLSIPDALRLLRAAGSKDKRTAFYPGAYHGWAIVEDAPYAATARSLILQWIRKH